jgi:hypothetical protein
MLNKNSALAGLPLELGEDQFQGELQKVGDVEQLRHGVLVKVLVYALLAELTDDQAETLKRQGAVNFSEAELKKHLNTPDFLSNVRPSTVLVARQVLKGFKNSN